MPEGDINLELFILFFRSVILIIDLTIVLYNK